MDSRFSNFTGEEREIIRRALRRFCDDLLDESERGLTDETCCLDYYSKVSALYFEVSVM